MQIKRRDASLRRSDPRIPIVLPRPGSATELPIHAHRAAILDAMRTSQVVIVAGETGCGKTTQLPQFCLDPQLSPTGRIAVTQPRRIAAIAMARRVAAETNSTLGLQVGYRVRFDELVKPGTGLTFMTDGMLLTEIPRDPLLSAYQTIIIDEAHERNLNIDFLLGYLRRILPRRPDLRLIISSATIDTTEFSAAFGNAPVIEVPGRLFPVEVWYRPLDQEALESGASGYIDAAVAAAEEIATAGDDGDVLIFMPTERDIHETIAGLNGKKLRHTLCLPLFSRLTKGEQERIFAPTLQRKIIVTTNIAETSLTVPGIRFVIDTGLARVNRYAPRLRTTRLPVEAISQASADQRKGRCGRVAAGLCIRLYEEKEYLSWPRFASPEIQRSNLASVILRMAELGLGSVDAFPFIAAPDASAVRDGYNQLTELGALDAGGRLTPLGRQMAALPLDPPIARMVIAARAEGCLREIAIIAAGLSIVDPRERPIDKKQEADQAHKKFVHVGSDFLTLLKLWDAYQSEWEQLKTQNALRRFCRNHFLSYTRMREWHDIHEQIRQNLRPGRRDEPAREPHPDAIHRCILAGLVTNVAMKRVEKDGYAAPRSREVFIFPGSVLSKKQPPWLVCHEIVETSRVFARTVGPIDPQWIEQLAPDLCRANYGEPFFEPSSGAVRARETVSFYGLPIVRNRLVDYRRIDAARAHEVFIRQALVEQQLLTHRPFLEHNRQQRERAEALEDKLRQRGIVADEEALCDFYHQRLAGITSSRELERLIRDRGGDRFLYMQEADVMAPQKDAEEFPDTLLVGGANYSLKYAFNPGGEDDGVTVEIPAADAPFVPQNLFGWLVPPLWPAKIATLLRALPKNLRKQFVPIPESSARLAARLRYEPRPFTDALLQVIREEFSLDLDPAQLSEAELPQHLQMRIVLTDGEGNTVLTTRGVQALETDPVSQSYSEWPAHVLERVASLEQRDIESWTVGEIPPAHPLSDPGEGIALQGYPGLTANRRGSVDYLLYPSQQAAQAAHHAGVVRLCELRLAEQLAWLDKDLKLPHAVKIACSPFGGAEAVCRNLAAAIRRHVLTIETALPLSKESFEATTAAMAGQLRGIASEAVGLLDRSLAAAGECRRLLEKLGTRHTSRIYVELRAELGEQLKALMELVVAPDLLYARFRQLPRSLSAFSLRIERGFADYAKHRERMNQLTPFANKAREALRRRPELTPEMQRQADTFLQMVDEFAIALFAHPNVKTLYPVSEKRLLERWDVIKQAFSN